MALESTIIAHGMPFPQNLDTAQAVEAVVREHGAVPATCAVLEGRCCVGLSPDQLHRLASGCACRSEHALPSEPGDSPGGGGCCARARRSAGHVCCPEGVLLRGPVP